MLVTYNNSIVVQFDTTVSGNSGANKQVSVYVHGSIVLADLFDENDDPLINPITASADGNYTFRAATGFYDLYIDQGMGTETAILNEPISGGAVAGGVSPIEITTDAMDIDATDHGFLYIISDSTGAVTITVKPNAIIDAGTITFFKSNTDSIITFIGEVDAINGDVVIESAYDPEIYGKYSMCALINQSERVWSLVGDLKL